MWNALQKTTGLSEERFAAIESRLGLDFRQGGRSLSAPRQKSHEPLREWCGKRSLAEIESCFAGTGVCWGPYRTFAQMVQEDPRVSDGQPDVQRDRAARVSGTIWCPGSPLSFSAFPREQPTPAPLLGEHSDEILAGELGLNQDEIDRLRREGVVTGPVENL
jgi:2-methylfumaryl-CoA isomerase